MNNSAYNPVYKSARILSFVMMFLFVAGCNSPETPAEATADRATSNTSSDTQLEEATTNSTTENPQPGTQQTKTILIFGDSITAGYGLEESQAFPAILQEKIDSLDWDYRVINGGLSGDTSAGGLRRINWMLRTPVDVLVLELGGNDGLRGTPPTATKQNLQAIIDAVEAENPEVSVILAGMQIPPNLGTEYTNQFKNVFPSLAAENDALLIPFLLENVGGIPELNLPDGIHPTAEGHKIVAQNVWKILNPLLESLNNAQVTP